MRESGQTMLQRKALKRMEHWKQHKTRQALLVVGARQVGKTYLIKAFAEANYESVVEFNLVEHTAACASFKEASSSEDLMLRMTI
ncbi:MAG: AAA family ATPase, partial [Coriobacteriia bacterium]|nr:AAA family ATPase [Coriobacteriia bacterium]